MRQVWVCTEDPEGERKTVAVEVEDDALIDHVMKAAIEALKLNTTADHVTVTFNDEAIKLEETVEHELNKGHGNTDDAPLLLVLSDESPAKQQLLSRYAIAKQLKLISQSSVITQKEHCTCTPLDVCPQEPLLSALYYAGFDQFVVDCESLQLEERDAQFFVDLTMELSQPHENDEQRKVAIRTTLGDYLDYTFLPMCNENLLYHVNGVMTDDAGDHFLAWKVQKNEDKRTHLNISARNSLEMYYFLYIQMKKDETNKGWFLQPCYLVRFGTEMTVFGALNLDSFSPCTEQLTHSLSLAFQPNNLPAMAQVAKTFKALKCALNHLKNYYEEPQLDKFPCFCKYKDRKTEKDIEITYVFQDKYTYCATTNTKTEVRVKFNEKNGSEVHDACAAEGFAPEVLCAMKVTSSYQMVVMEDLGDDAMHLDHYIKKHPEHKAYLLERCKLALDALHKQGFCHGDFRPNNILVVPAPTSIGMDIKAIDFDYSGKMGSARYPDTLNLCEIEWHDGVYPGGPLQPEHDSYWLEKIFPS